MVAVRNVGSPIVPVKAVAIIELSIEAIAVVPTSEVVVIRTQAVLRSQQVQAKQTQAKQTQARRAADSEPAHRVATVAARTIEVATIEARTIGAEAIHAADVIPIVVIHGAANAVVNVADAAIVMIAMTVQPPTARV